MAEKIIMPQLGTTMTEGMVHKWLKQVGDKVKKGDVLVEFSTDKYAAEIESEADGILRAMYVQEGEEVPVLTVLGIIAGQNEEIEEPAKEMTGRNQDKDTEAEVNTETEPIIEQVKTNNLETRIKASPLAKKTAQNLGVNLAQVPYSKTTGRIKQKDVLEFHESNLAQSATMQGQNKSYGATVMPTDTQVLMSTMRRVIGKRMTESIVTAPQVTEMCEANVDKLIELRNNLNSQSQDVKITFTDILIKITAAALRQIPQMNASRTQDSIILHDRINVGIAVALDNGLVVPVVKDADRKGVKAISTEIKELAGRAREGKLSSEDTQGGTFTVSNLGSFGVEGFTPIVNLPECGILGVGRIVRKPIVDENDQIVPANMMMMSLTFDHRVVDGALAAKLLKLIVDYIEYPGRMYL